MMAFLRSKEVASTYMAPPLTLWPRNFLTLPPSHIQFTETVIRHGLLSVCTISFSKCKPKVFLSPFFISAPPCPHLLAPYIIFVLFRHWKCRLVAQSSDNIRLPPFHSHPTLWIKVSVRWLFSCKSFCLIESHCGLLTTYPRVCR